MVYTIIQELIKEHYNGLLDSGKLNTGLHNHILISCKITTDILAYIILLGLPISTRIQHEREKVSGLW